jgi:hypothetical protein
MTRLLLDTHAFLWWLAGDEMLSVGAREAIGEEQDSVFVSAASDIRHINRCDWHLLAGGWCSSIQDGTGHLECRAPSSEHR